MEKKRCTAIVLAAGQGKRMGTKTQKQYLNLCGYPVLWHCLHTFEESAVIDDMILVRLWWIMNLALRRQRIR